jgi:Bacterial capsule synthesis protein PGA_cap
MADRCRLEPSSLRPLLAVAALLAPALAAVAILVAPAPGGDPAAPAAASTARAERGHAAKTLTIGWVGDVTPGSQYGVPGDGGRALFAAVRRDLREPDLMIANLEGTLGVGGASKCPPGAANCFAFQAPPENAGALHDAGIDIVNLANNHSFDYGEAGRTQTLRALTAGHVAFTGLPGDVRVLTRRGIRVAFVGFSTYRWTPSMDDPAPLIDQANAIADVVVVLFHAGAEGSDKTAVPLGREYAFGEDRGDERAFAHRAIDAGADLVLGSGPHVIRGMETYRGRLIAYSLGNFAGAGTFASGGTLSVSGLLSVRVDRRGRARNGWWRGMTLDSSGAPRPDAGASRALVAQLSARDFGAAAPRILPSGRIVVRGGA